MARIKRGTASHKRHKNILDKVKGFRWGRKSHIRLAKEALLHAGTYAYRDRRTKKRSARRLWILRLNNGLRLHGFTYSKFIPLLTAQNITLDRKVLSTLAAEHPERFARVVTIITKSAPTEKI